MKKWIVILTGLMLFGCSSTPKIEKIPDSANATDEVNRFEKDMTDSMANRQSDVLSPNAWKEASDYLKEAKTRLADQRDKSRVLYSVEKGRAWMDKANSHADQAASVIPDIMQVRKEAIDSGARQYAKDEFSSAEQAFRQYTRDRENSDFGIPSDKRATFRDDYIFAQTTALQSHLLGEARKNIYEAKEKGAQTLLPDVWTLTVRSLKNAEGYIAANRNDESGIEAQSKKAVQDALKLNRLTDEAVASKNETPEQRAIAVDRMKQRNQNLSASLDEQAFDQKYDEARQMFDPKDAEVYKQGNRLLIRVKGIDFPTGSASLPPSSYPLITKVSGAIKSFGDNTKVRIEGHTDSTGGKAVNKRLSQQRGEAVKTYLTSNGNFPPDSIEVVGISDTRPIASNKTADGRAQNRSVDVFVIPQVQQTPQIRQAQ